MKPFGGHWSESKLDCVEEYATQYLRVMQHQSWCDLHYVDAFAGRGRQVLKPKPAEAALIPEIDAFFGNEAERTDTEDFLVGSAIRALRASSASPRPFDQFTLIEEDRASCEELTALIDSDFPEKRADVRVVCEDANAALDAYVNSIDWSRTRALVFLDPYGLEVGWDTIRRLAGTNACDVWYLFPIGGVIRMMTNDGQIPASWQARLDTLFGTHEWFDEFYTPTGQQSLFLDDSPEMRKNASTTRVVNYIRLRLGHAFQAVSEARVLRNSTGAPLFALVMGVSNPSPAAQKPAIKIANHLLRKLTS